MLVSGSRVCAYGRAGGKNEDQQNAGDLVAPEAIGRGVGDGFSGDQFKRSKGYVGGESNQSAKTETSYLQNRFSRVMMHSFSSRAWAIIILSKGSRWCIGSPPAAYA